TCYENLRASATDLRQAHRTLQERHQAAERDLEIHDALTRIAMEGEDVDVVVRTVASLTASSAAVVTDDGRVLAAHSRGAVEALPARLQEWVAQAQSESPPDGEPVTVKEEGWWMLVTPVRA